MGSSCLMNRPFFCCFFRGREGQVMDGKRGKMALERKKRLITAFQPGDE